MAKVYIDLDQMWLFYPLHNNNCFSSYDKEKFNLMLETNKTIEIDDTFLDNYKKVSDEFHRLNSYLEDLFRQQLNK